MKKILLATILTACLGVAGVCEASYKKRETCSYSPLQDLIRNARSGADLQPVLNGRVDLNAPVKCGGTILQLAIRRGNPEVVKLLLENGLSVTDNVSLDGFPIEGAPDNVPLLMFTAYYSPRQDILNLIISAGADMTVTDENGENVLWYLEKNPVLQNTVISDSIKNALLFNVKSVSDQQKNNSETPVQPNPTNKTPTAQGSGIPVQPAPQMIISKQPDGSVGVPTEVIQALGADALSSGIIIQPKPSSPLEIVEPSMPVK